MPKEIGRVGQRRYSGIFYEEFLPELTGLRGIETYKEMSGNDELVTAMLYAIKMLLRQTAFQVDPASGSARDRQAAEFVESCLGDMQTTWQDTLAEILSFITYGWSYHEIVYKRRRGRSRDPRYSSKYNDGLIGWRKLPVRAQDSLVRWEYDRFDELKGMVQKTAPDYKEVLIPIEKALHFRTCSNKENPEGQSVLRGAYRSWYFKKHIQEIEGIGIERDLAGLPVLYVNADAGIWDDTEEGKQKLARCEAIVSSIRRDAREGLVLPEGYRLELLSSGGKRNFSTSEVIERWDKRIAMTTLADFILLGQQGVGSFALSSDKTKLFATAMGTYLDIICDVFNTQAIPRLMELNREHFAGITGCPTLSHGDIEDRNLTSLGDFLHKTVSCGALSPDPALEEYIRRTAGLPDLQEEYPMQPPPGPGASLSPVRDPPGDMLDDPPDGESLDPDDEEGEQV